MRCPNWRRINVNTTPFFETTVPIITKFHIEPPEAGGKKSCSNELGHMTNMAALLIYGKNLKKSSSPEPKNRWPWNLVCSIVYASTTKVVQIMAVSLPCISFIYIYVRVLLNKRKVYHVINFKHTFLYLAIHVKYYVNCIKRLRSLNLQDKFIEDNG